MLLLLKNYSKIIDFGGIFFISLATTDKKNIFFMSLNYGANDHSLFFSFFFCLSLGLKQDHTWQRSARSFYLKVKKKTFLSRSRKFPASISTWGFAPACESEPRNFRGGESNLKAMVMEGCSRQSGDVWRFLCVAESIYPCSSASPPLCCCSPGALTRYRRPRNATPTPEPFWFCSLYL